MFEYIKGIVTEINSGYIVVENNNVGYLVYVSNPYSFTENKDYKVYLYQKVAEDENSLYGFKTKEDKDMFLRLIGVKGLGPKTALSLLSAGTLDSLVEAIEKEDINYIKKFPKIGDKVARQIILDLKGKLVSKENNIVEDTELIEALKALGYKASDIKGILPKIDNKLSIEERIKQGLKLLLK